jgi:ubiquinone/menaquinone biosynthesis C-methylase UbiE
VAQADVRHPIFARLWSRLCGPTLDRAGLGIHRQRLLAGLSGRVLEIGAGDGLNFAHYPSSVTTLIALEPEPRLRALAEQAASTAPIPIQVVAGRAEKLPAEDETFDAAVACLTLCSVADPAAALTELHRVLKPGASLHLLEHVRSDSPRMRRFQRMADATLWPPLMGGCHTGRDTESEVLAAGFGLVSLERFNFPPSQAPSLAGSFILGVAERR